MSNMNFDDKEEMGYEKDWAASGVVSPGGKYDGQAFENVMENENLHRKLKPRQIAMVRRLSLLRFSTLRWKTDFPSQYTTLSPSSLTDCYRRRRRHWSSHWFRNRSRSRRTGRTFARLHRQSCFLP